MHKQQQIRNYNKRGKKTANAYLPRNVFEVDGARLQIHEQRRLELIFGAVKLNGTDVVCH